MLLNNLRGNIPSLPTIALTVAMAIGNTQARAIDIVASKSHYGASSLGEEYKKCIEEEQAQFEEDQLKHQEEKQKLYWKKIEENLISPIEPQIPGKIPTDISQQITKTGEKIYREFNENVSEFNKDDRRDMIVAWNILEDFAGEVSGIKNTYFLISEPYTVEELKEIFNFPGTSEEADKEAEDLKKRRGLELRYIKSRERANEAQKYFVDTFGKIIKENGKRVIRDHYDLIHAIQRSDDITAKQNLEQILTLAQEYARSDFLTKKETIQQTLEFNTEAKESFSAQRDKIDGENDRLDDRVDVLRTRLSQKLFPEGIHQESYSKKAVAKTKLIDEVFGYVWQTDVPLSFDTFLAEQSVCIPEFVDISVLSQDFMSKLRDEYLIIPNRKSTDFENFKYEGLSSEELFPAFSWVDIWSRNGDLLTYGIPVTQVFENWKNLLDYMQEDDKSLKTAYTSYLKYYRLTDYLNDVKESEFSILLGYEEEFDKIFTEVRERQKQQFEMFQERKKQLGKT